MLASVHLSPPAARKSSTPIGGVCTSVASLIVPSGVPTRASPVSFMIAEWTVRFSPRSIRLDGIEVLRRKELFAPAAAAPVLPAPSEGGNYAILLLLVVVGLGVAAAIVFSRRRGAA